MTTDPFKETNSLTGSDLYIALVSPAKEGAGLQSAHALQSLGKTENRSFLRYFLLPQINFNCQAVTDLCNL